MCSGEACDLCGAGCWAGSGHLLGPPCEHDVLERHAEEQPLDGRILMPTTRKTTKPSNKPFVEMKPKEMERTLDGIWKDLRGEILGDARNTDNFSAITVAALVLTLPGGTRRIAHYDTEYGDDDGVNHMIEFKREVERTKSLLPGESVEVVKLSVPFEQMAYEPVVDPPRKRRGRAAS
jgi:hypothetical protein